MTEKIKLHPVVTAILGGLVLACVTATPLVDDGLTASEILKIVVAGLVGSGLTAVPSDGIKLPSRKR